MYDAASPVDAASIKRLNQAPVKPGASMPASFDETSFHFGGFKLDLRKGVLHKNDAPAFLRPKPMAVITHLARNMGRVVPKSELMDTVWPGIFVTEDSLTQAIREIRKALGDDKASLIRNRVAPRLHARQTSRHRRGNRIAADRGGSPVCQ
jgi:DNA-binding response OmpR family regulator